MTAGLLAADQDGAAAERADAVDVSPTRAEMDLRAQVVALGQILFALDINVHNAAVLRSRCNLLDYARGMETARAFTPPF